MGDNDSLNQDTFKDILLEHIQEQRRSRRWKIFFKLVGLSFFLFFIIIVVTSKPSPGARDRHSHTALIDIRGPIFDNAQSNADNITASLRLAFKDKNTKGIILRINSPGGSPVQANYIFNDIIRLRHQHKKIKIYAVCTDGCLSAAYYIAAATDAIFANPSSVVGSIGVIYNGFGFVDTLQKLGIQRRVLTAGKNKAFLDPFIPWNNESKSMIQTMLNDVHKQFIHNVRLGRGNRLKNDPQIFSGLIWLGSRSKSLGLIDGFGNTSFVAREVIKEERIINYTIKPNYLEKLAEHFGASVSTNGLKQLGFGQLWR